ncbi:MAG: inositol monophosphatase [candidate division KSB1 bacterium]|nr:inositol monophosphatase [candidate division KSB1 bacterium]MDZ7365259.1 inositol monophosphatase [candidate division KSB1 bacterium]MDZ7403126.1 inositol monophosphatase [candidate division KSB1 bacterium]
MSPQHLLDTAITAAQAGGEKLLAMASRHETLRIETKTEADFVTVADRAAEETIVKHLLAAFPDHHILAEEQTHVETGEKTSASSTSVQWIIDPLDGTTNYIHGVPNFSVSIAARQNAEVIAGVVWDPLQRELFTATKGGGAFLNGKPIHVSATARLRDGLIATGFPFRVRHFLDSYCRMFKDFLQAARDLRRFGSAALDLAYVAAGRFDGFWEYCLNPWDFAAGALLVREAGGEISGFSANENFWGTGNIVASNGKLHQAMLEIILKHHRA